MPDRRLSAEQQPRLCLSRWSRPIPHAGQRQRGRQVRGLFDSGHGSAATIGSLRLHTHRPARSIRLDSGTSGWRLVCSCHLSIPPPARFILPERGRFNWDFAWTELASARTELASTTIELSSATTEMGHALAHFEPATPPAGVILQWPPVQGQRDRQTRHDPSQRVGAR